MKKMLEMCGT